MEQTYIHREIDNIELDVSLLQKKTYLGQLNSTKKKKKKTNTTNIHDHLLANEEGNKRPESWTTKFTVCQLDPYNKPSIAHKKPRD